MLNLKAEAFAYQLGTGWAPTEISLLEQKEIIEEPLLKRIAEILKIPVEMIKHYDEKQEINIISNDSGKGEIKFPNFHDTGKN